MYFLSWGTFEKWSTFLTNLKSTLASRGLGFFMLFLLFLKKAWKSTKSTKKVKLPFSWCDIIREHVGHHGVYITPVNSHCVCRGIYIWANLYFSISSSVADHVHNSSLSTSPPKSHPLGSTTQEQGVLPGRAQGVMGRLDDGHAF